MLLIAALLEMVTTVAAPLLLNVAVLSGTVPPVQLVPVVHSPGPGGGAVQVASTACADLGHSAASAPSHTPPSSAARVRADGAAAGIARAPTGAPGARCRRARTARGRERSESISPAPCTHTAGEAQPCDTPCRPRGSTNLRSYAARPARSIRDRAVEDDWRQPVALPPRGAGFDLDSGVQSTTSRDHEYVMNMILTTSRGL